MNADNETNPIAPSNHLSDAWGYSSAVATCPACKSTFIVPPAAQNNLCPVCFSSNLSSQSDPRISGAPELAIPFAIDRQKSTSLFESWLKGLVAEAGRPLRTEPG